MLSQSCGFTIFPRRTVAAGRLEDADALLNRHTSIPIEVVVVYTGEYSDIDADGFVSEGTSLPDGLPECFGVGLSKRREDTYTCQILRQ